MLRKNIANIITITRIFGTICMLFFDVPSKWFYIAYVYSGLSDVLDGFFARRLKIESDLGRKLDSVSDLLFYTTMMFKIWPYLQEYLPAYIWAIIWVTLVIRVCLYLYFTIKNNTFLSSHNALNKITGALMFALPFMIKNKTVFVIYSNFVSIFAFIAAIYEFKGIKK